MNYPLTKAEQQLVQQGDIKNATLQLRDRLGISLKQASDAIKHYRVEAQLLIPPTIVGMDNAPLNFRALVCFYSTLAPAELAQQLSGQLGCQLLHNSSGRFEEFITYEGQVLGIPLTLQLNDAATQQYLLEITPHAKADTARQTWVDLSQHLAAQLTQIEAISAISCPENEAY
ncbi:hypothetical protein [Shewanella sp.]|uniref:hypothetical protein n=1 Tax=Shewanella sp. TaxID=50422 RepID=UPI003A97C5BE